MLRFCAISILDEDYRLGKLAQGGELVTTAIVHLRHPSRHQKILSSLICGWKGHNCGKPYVGEPQTLKLKDIVFPLCNQTMLAE